MICTDPPPPSEPTIIVESITLQATSISFSWTQSAGDVVDNYTVGYNFSVRGCSDVPQQNYSITLGGSSRMVNMTGIQEDSTVMIKITVNNAGGSTPRLFTDPRRTLTASKCAIRCI